MTALYPIVAEPLQGFVIGHVGIGAGIRCPPQKQRVRLSKMNVAELAWMTSLVVTTERIPL
jgi:hypothetical protein